jgi:hypothetical protein
MRQPLNDNLRAWLAPLITEAEEKGVGVTAAFLIASRPPEGKLNGPANWELFGQLLIRDLGLEGSYPSTPDGERRSISDYQALIKAE